MSSSLLDRVAALLGGTDPDTADEYRPVPARPEYRKVGQRRGRATHQARRPKRQRAEPHPFAERDTRTVIQRADDDLAAAKIDAAWHRNEALDQPEPWITPAVEQGYRNRRVGRRRQRQARRRTRLAAR